MFKKVMLFVLFIFSIVLIGCGETEKTIEVSKKGKAEYYVGETFDPTGYVLTVKVDGKSEDVDLTVSMTDINGPFESIGEKIINVTYEIDEDVLETRFKVEVINKRLVDLQIKEIGKDKYYLNEEFDPSGYILEIKYDDNSKKELPLTDEMVEDFDSTTEGEKNITIKYTENDVTLTKKVTVLVEKLVVVKSIEVKSFGKITYEVDEKFDIDNYVLLVKYSDDSEKEVLLTEDMIKSTVDTSTSGSKDIEIEYAEKDVKVSCIINITVNEKVRPFVLKIVKYGETVYTLDMEFSLEGFEFEVEYTDGTTKPVDVSKIECDKFVYHENYEDEPEIINIPISYVIDGVKLEQTIETNNIAEWDYEEYIGRKEAEKMFPIIYEHVQEIIPTTATEDIPLPKTTEFGIDYILKFSTSNSNVLSPLGKINPKEEDVQVQIKLIIENDYKTETYTWDVIVKGLGPVILRPWIESEKHVFAYFYEGTSSTMSEKDAQKVDVINYCFARVSSGLCSIDGLRYLKENMKLRRSTGVRIVLSIGGGGTGSAGFSDACITDEKRAKFVESIMDIVKEYSFDGIDLDWEYPAWVGLSDSRPEDKDNFTKLCKELRVALDEYKDGMLLTSAMIGGINVERFYDLPELNKYLDYFHLMTYDLNSSGLTTHHSNTLPGNRVYSCKNAMETYKSGGVDASKIVIGAAFYGKISTLATPTTPTSAVLLKPIAKTEEGKDDTKTIQFTKIKEQYLTNPDFVKLYDAPSGAYYLTDGKTFITYDDPEIFVEKADLVKNNNLGGLMFWDYGSDSTGTLLYRLCAEVDRINQGR